MINSFFKRLKLNFLNSLKEFRWEIWKVLKIRGARVSIAFITSYGILIYLLNNFLALLSWFFLGNLYAGVIVQPLKRYQMDFISYLLLGLLLQQVSGISRQVMQFHVFDQEYKMLYMSPTNPLRFLMLSHFIISFLTMIPKFLIQAFITFIIFKPQIDFNRLPICFLISLSATIADFALYLMIDSLAFYKPRLAVTGNPIRFVFQLLERVVDGLYYPIEILPWGLRVFTYFFPGASSLLAARLYLAGDSDFITYLKALIISSIILILTARLVVNKGLETIRRRGFTSTPLV